MLKLMMVTVDIGSYWLRMINNEGKGPTIGKIIVANDVIICGMIQKNRCLEMDHHSFQGTSHNQQSWGRLRLEGRGEL